MKQTDSSSSTLVERWLQNEYRHATGEWKRHFRGDIVEASVEQLSAGIQSSTTSTATVVEKNWILFGTPENNPIMAKVVDSLPIQWNSREIVVGDRRYSSEHHILSMIYPNPFEKETLRRLQQWIHLSRIRVSQQRQANTDVARLGCGRYSRGSQ